MIFFVLNKLSTTMYYLILEDLIHSENTRFHCLTKRMPGIGYVEPYKVASIVTVNKTHMPGIGFVGKMNARNRLC